MDRDRDKKSTQQHQGSDKSGKGSQSTPGGRENPRDSQGQFTGGKSSQGSQSSQGGKGSKGTEKDEAE